MVISKLALLALSLLLCSSSLVVAVRHVLEDHHHQPIEISPEVLAFLNRYSIKIPKYFESKRKVPTGPNPEKSPPSPWASNLEEYEPQREVPNGPDPITSPASPIADNMNN
ncbi:hypothetical protein FRX31_030661 [Thalictrum thalictroides]|uniref:Transmembrane protein n=1 Tax=Thalictrum thalictroides TaxID=46969 RepID=A0A7J6V4V2_THATH|nr:hypothetical protein FRX31_030661 [Thalictrum thalictroides]